MGDGWCAGHAVCGGHWKRTLGICALQGRTIVESAQLQMSSRSAATSSAISLCPASNSDIITVQCNVVYVVCKEAVLRQLGGPTLQVDYILPYIPLVVILHIIYITFEYFRWVNFQKKGEVGPNPTNSASTVGSKHMNQGHRLA